MSEKPGPYTLNKLHTELVRQLPLLLRGLPRILTGLAGPDGVGLPTRVAMQLRLARLLGCPVCLELFPRIAARVGLSPVMVARATQGQVERLEPAAAGAVAWVEALVALDGAEPELVPGAAMALSTGQRAHLAQMVRLGLVIHAAGLMFVPHSLIHRAWSGGASPGVRSDTRKT